MDKQKNTSDELDRFSWNDSRAEGGGLRVLRAVGRRRLIVRARAHERRRRRCVAFVSVCVCATVTTPRTTYAAGRKGGRASGQWSRMAHA